LDHDDPMEYTHEEAVKHVEDYYNTYAVVKSRAWQVWCGLIHQHNRARNAVSVEYGPALRGSVTIMWCHDCGKRL
jgi:hypothetical protein